MFGSKVLTMRYYITRGTPPKFFKLAWAAGDGPSVNWTTDPNEANVWTNGRTADQVARMNGGMAIDEDQLERMMRAEQRS
jgi:hypothetical protein